MFAAIGLPLFAFRFLALAVTIQFYHRNIGYGNLYWPPF